LVHPFEYQQSYESRLVCELLKQELLLISGVEIISVNPSEFLSEVTQSVPGLRHAARILERLTLSPMLLRMRLDKIEQKARKQKRDFSVLLSDQSLGTLTHALTGYKILIFVHSLADFHAVQGGLGQPKGYQGRFEARMNTAGLIAAEGFITPTQTVMRELDSLSVGAQKRTIVAPLPLRHCIASKQELDTRLANLWRTRGIFPPPYILHCGSAHWNNNRSALIYLCSELKKTRPVAPSLVFAGEEPSREEGSLIESTGISFYHFSEPSQQDVETLLHGAICLAEIPALDGLGYHALQALDLGTPIAITQTDTLMETLSEAAAIITPVPTQDNVEEWSKESAKAVGQLLDMPEEDKANMAQEALSYTSGFTEQRFQGAIAKALEG
jgi:hypothetical protein